MFDVVGEHLGVVRFLLDMFQFVRIVPCCNGLTVVLLRLKGVLLECLITTLISLVNPISGILRSGLHYECIKMRLLNEKVSNLMVFLKL